MNEPVCRVFDKHNRLCGNRARPYGLGDPTCWIHGNQGKGTGVMVCQICGNLQKDHALGYFEHVDVIGMKPTPTAARRVRRDRVWKNA